PAMIHRAPFGSLERFIAILIEHTGGKFPFWLAPEQLAILPISDKFSDYAKNVNSKLLEKGFRTYVDNRDEKIGKKIRDAELNKIPFMLILGEKEQRENKVSLRKQGKGDQGQYSIENLIE